MFKKLFLSLFILLSLPAFSQPPLEYQVQTRNGFKTVPVENIDKSLRKLNGTQIESFLEKGGTLLPVHYEDGSVGIRPFVPLRAGGVWGATIGAFVGKVAVEGGVRVVVYGVTRYVGGNEAYEATMATIGPTVTKVANKVAIGTAMIGGTLTGPV
jgi:hypothetical protein